MSLLTPTRSPAQRAAQPSRLPLRYLDDHILLTDKEAWTVVGIPTVNYDFLPAEQQIRHAVWFTMSITALVTGHDSVQGHLMVVNDPFDSQAWAKQLNDKVARQRPAPGWIDHLSGMASRIDSMGFRDRFTYLAVCLGERTSAAGAFREAIAPLARLSKWFETKAGFDDYTIDPAEIARWHRLATEVRRSLSMSRINAVGCSSGEVAHLIQRPFWPSMIQPADTKQAIGTWGAGSIEGLVEGEVTEMPRSICVEQRGDYGSSQQGHSVAVSAYRFPEEMQIPIQEPWILALAALEFPVDVSVRFTLEPAIKVRKDIQGRLNTAREQAEHIAEAGVDVPLQVTEALEVATALEYQIDKQREPWIYGRHRFHVSGASEDEAAARAQHVIEKIRESGLSGTVATGDQMDLWLEQIPGTPVKATAHLQRHAADILGGGIPHGSVIVGDRASDGAWTGSYLGYTTVRQCSPVFIDLHAVIARNKSGGMAITGQPGNGKSHAGFWLAYQQALSGVWTILLDPSGAAMSMAGLPGMPHTEVFDLSEGYDGLLDPFLLGTDISQQKLYAVEIVYLLLGGRLSEEREEVLMQAINTVCDAGSPSMAKLVVALLNSGTPAGVNLGETLRTISQFPFARLCFAEHRGAELNPAAGMTIVSLLGLPSPEPSRKLEEYTYEERLGAAIMFLLTSYTRKLLYNLDRQQPKSLIVDEAWGITPFEQGRKMLAETMRTGRKRNLTVIIITQNAADLMTSELANQITSKLSFCTTDPQEISNVLEFHGLPDVDMNRDVIRNLNNGEAVLQDAERRISRVQIDSWNSEVKDAFDSNPHNHKLREMAA